VSARLFGGHPLTFGQIVRLAHDIEDGLRISYTGLQDQVATTFGGANRWIWDYRVPESPFRREVLIPESRCGELSHHMLLVRTSSVQRDFELTAEWVRGFLSGATRHHWFETSDATVNFANALKELAWSDAAKWLQRETELRLGMGYPIVTSVGRDLIMEAGECDCGARFAGDGKGGCFWAIGPANAIEELRGKWRRRLQGGHLGGFLPCEVDCRGLILS
jgi:galactokinase/mevalonate kinase-like predicted kinase